MGCGFLPNFLPDFDSLFQKAYTLLTIEYRPEIVSMKNDAYAQLSPFWYHFVIFEVG